MGWTWLDLRLFQLVLSTNQRCSRLNYRVQLSGRYSTPAPLTNNLLDSPIYSNGVPVAVIPRPYTLIPPGQLSVSP